MTWSDTLGQVTAFNASVVLALNVDLDKMNELVPVIVVQDADGVPESVFGDHERLETTLQTLVLTALRKELGELGVHVLGGGLSLEELPPSSS